MLLPRGSELICGEPRDAPLYIHGRAHPLAHAYGNASGRDVVVVMTTAGGDRGGGSRDDDDDDENGENQGVMMVNDTDGDAGGDKGGVENRV